MTAVSTLAASADVSPARYSIESLLAGGVQPFEDLDGEMLGALAKGIDQRKALAVPVVISSDGVLVDGHQRLRAMALEGRKFIDAHDVRILPDVTTENALEWAVRLNVQRRQLTIEEKAEIARRLQRERKWTQMKIAALFGVSQAAVSQWLAPDKPKAPKGRPRGPVAPTNVVLAESKRHAAELTNPSFALWIADHIEPTDVEECIGLWDAIAAAAKSIAESLAAIEVPDGEPF